MKLIMPKLRMEPSLAEKRKESQKQLRDTVRRIEQALFGDPERLDRGLAIVAKAFSVSPVPKTADVYTDAYLPSPQERMLKF